MSRRLAGPALAAVLSLGCVTTAALGASRPVTLEFRGDIGTVRGDLGSAGLPGMRSGSVALRDYDGDGDMDFALVAGKEASRVTRVYRNDGNGFFSLVASCGVLNDSTFCEGDQSAGVTIAKGTNFYLWVRNLTSDITPASGVAGVQATGTAGAKVNVMFLGGGHAIVTHGNGAHGIIGTSTGSNGANGADDWGIFWAVGGNGAAGGNGGRVYVSNDGAISTDGVGAAGIGVVSVGGNGGRGGDATFSSVYSEGGDGASGGRGGDVSVNNLGSITTHGDNSAGIVAVSRGGDGGRGGDAAAIGGAVGGDGGHGGIAGWAQVHNEGAITTEGTRSHGIVVQSLGGIGGRGGNGGGIYGEGGGGSGAGSSFNATVNNSGTILTLGNGSNGIFAQAIGGFGSGGGGSGGVASFGGQGATGGNAWLARIDNTGNVTTVGMNANALSAQSIGGGGGSGAASGGIYSLGGSGSAGGNGGPAKVYNTGRLETQGDSSSAIWVQSIGGGGGDGAGSGGLVSLGGGGSSTGNGKEAIAANTGTILTAGAQSYAIFAQSIGGGGGSGAGSGGLVSIGGSGNAGGTGGEVTVTNSGSLLTQGVDATAIFAQSVGGGGGNGGSSGGIASFGGRGSVTSDGGRVTVVNSGDIQTGSGSDASETGAQAIFAQSVGGGGGNGGSSGGWFSIGGAGSGGGDASAVRVENTGSLLTTDDNSSAIFAQSVGGGGGNGGGSGAYGGMPLTLSIGGSGSRGGTGDTVNVSTDAGSVVTEGDNAHGILAQSIGGGGGNGGFSIAGSWVTSPIKVSLGGSGGPGGSGGIVNVQSGSSIATSGTDAHGIVAQSIGGGGGTGGFSISGSLGGGVNYGFSFGGSGGIGGNGSAVNVGTVSDPLHGTITTTGERSYGILAQSIGGGGGSGGFTVSASLLGLSSMNLGFGGKGGTGGRGDVVTVLSNANIFTGGASAHGIVAQSIGGGGGAGGWTLAGGATAFGGTTLSLGGSGGAGAKGGVVEVTNGGVIETEGELAHGILAQSIGGGGGNGGIAGTVMLNFADLIPLPPQIPVKVSSNIAVSVGGTGGTGGTADTVRVTNDGGIVTHGESSQGIVAQSIGGGGGAGGKSVAATANVGLSVPGGGTPQPSISLDVGVAVGGAGGAGNHGGVVDVVNAGGIDTQGDGSHGVLAQSIGGGGGTGGSARSMTVGIDPAEWVGIKDPFSLSLEVNVAVGGTGGSGGNGAKVSVENSGTILTRGADAHGILAQSIGGGGGVGGGGYHGLDWSDLGVDDRWIPDLERFAPDIGPELNNAKVVVGGQGGASGNGAAVDIVNSGTIRTLGDGSFGILVQSIGGGGGIGGVGALGDGTVGVGGRGGSAGDGGAVTIESNGLIETFGTAAHAILAQSIGGGGGIGGNVDRGIQVFGLNPAFGANGGSAGSGGTVLLNAIGDIVTHGEGASGIVAQSIGGGGGIGGDLGFGLGFGGSVGGDGSGGDVTVDLEGSIRTDGDGSHGIIAQSAAGRGSGGSVDVTVDGDVRVDGADTHGIVAQSRGNAGSGDITILVESGTVQGGRDEGAGVLILNGDQNVLTNHGTITSLGGTAIRASGNGNETIENNGLIAGLVDLAGGANNFYNRSDGRFESGAVVNLGHGGRLLNEGVFSPGGSGVTTTSLYGDFVQTETGTYEVTLNGREHDQLDVLGGSASIDGTLHVVADHDAYRDGDTFEFINASEVDGTFSQVMLPETAFLHFDMQYLADEGVRIQANVTPFGNTATNPLHRSIAGVLDHCVTDASGDMSHMIGRFQLSSPGQVAEAFYSLSPASYDNLSRSAFQSASLLQENLALRMDASRSRPSPEMSASTGRSYEGGSGWWLSGGYQGADQDPSGGFLKHNFSTSTALGGYERAVGRTILGASFGFAHATVDLDNEHADGTADGYIGSLYGGLLSGRTFAQSVLSVGTNTFDNRRDVHVGDEVRMATSDHRGTTLAALATGGTRIPAGRWGLEPFATVRYTHVSEEAFTEDGAGSVNLVVDKHGTDWMQSDLGVRFTTSVMKESWALLPELRMAWNHDFGLDREIVAAFEGDPEMPFTTTGESVDPDGLTAGLGLTYHTTSGWKASVRYERTQRGDYQANGFMVRLGSGF